MAQSELTLTRAYKDHAAGETVTVTDAERTYLVEQKFAKDPEIVEDRPGIMKEATFQGIGGDYRGPRQDQRYGDATFDPSTKSVAEVVAYLGLQGGAEVRRVKEAEARGQNRTTIANYSYQRPA